MKRYTTPQSDILSLSALGATMQGLMSASQISEPGSSPAPARVTEKTAEAVF